jgi:hypothetical protein
VNFFRHEYSGQRKVVFSGIVTETWGVHYTLSKETKVGAVPQPRHVEAKDTFSYLISPQHHHKNVPYTPGFAKMLHV